MWLGLGPAGEGLGRRARGARSCGATSARRRREGAARCGRSPFFAGALGGARPLRSVRHDVVTSHGRRKAAGCTDARDAGNCEASVGGETGVRASRRGGPRVSWKISRALGSSSVSSSVVAISRSAWMVHGMTASAVQVTFGQREGVGALKILRASAAHTEQCQGEDRHLGN